MRLIGKNIPVVDDHPFPAKLTIPVGAAPHRKPVAQRGHVRRGQGGNRNGGGGGNSGSSRSGAKRRFGGPKKSGRSSSSR